MLMADELGQGIGADHVDYPETQFHVHLGEVTIEFLLCHLVDSSENVLVCFTEGFANLLIIPRESGRTDIVPSFCLPLVLLFPCRGAALYILTTSH